LPLLGRSALQSSSPLTISNARNSRSNDAAMKIRPVAVTIGPPISILPFIIDMGHGARPPSVPKGFFQSMSPLSRSTAASVLHGGALHGAPSGDSSGVISAQYGEPICGITVGFGHFSRGTSFNTAATCFVFTTMR